MEIIREKKFDEQVELLCQDYGRMYDLDDAIDWALLLNPNGVINIPGVLNLGGECYLWVTDEFFAEDIPRVRILFQYDGDYTVTLLSIATY